MTAEIFEFTGLTTAHLPPKKVLKYTEDLKEVIVIGIGADDEIYVAGSSSNIAETIYMIELGKRYLLKLTDTEK